MLFCTWINTNVYRKDERSNSKYKRLFLKRADRRTQFEKRHIKKVHKDNRILISLEIIKEGMHDLFASRTQQEAREKFEQIQDWVEQEKLITHLKSWWDSLNLVWDTFKNYFSHPYTTALSEGKNNVIKTIKKRGYGYRNMNYFKLKILQVCGYLNSNWISMDFQ